MHRHSLAKTLLPLLALVATLTGCVTAVDTVRQELYDRTFGEAAAPRLLLDDPVARLADNHLLVAPGEVAGLDGSASRSHEGRPLRYRWTLLERPRGSSTSLVDAVNPRLELPIDQPGDYRVQLVVNDGRFDAKPVEALITTEPDHLPKVRFAVLGDFGTGSSPQYRVAEALKAVCAARGCDFVLGTGDNIYPRGVSSVDDPQFDSAFERPYRGLNRPFFMVLGNHDNNGLLGSGDGGYNAHGELEIDYGKRDGRPSEMWVSPARYYQFKAPLPAQRGAGWLGRNRRPLAQFLAIDTTPLTSAPDPVPRYHLQRYAARQGAWLDSALNTSRPPWRIAFGHHPYLSNGEHGDAGNYERIADDLPALRERYPRFDDLFLGRIAGKHFKRFFDEHLCGEVDFYLSGHDHNLQWLKPVARCEGTHFIVSGAGAKTTELRWNGENPSYWQRGRTGFFWFELEEGSARVVAFAVDPRSGEYHVAHEQRVKR